MTKSSDIVVYSIFEGSERFKMKVDMSPKAITERLKTMNELWLLSVKLMNSKKIKSATGEEQVTFVNKKIDKASPEKQDTDLLD